MCPIVAHFMNAKKPQKRTTKHLKGKKRNNHAYDSNTANFFSHIIEHYSNTGEDKARIIQLAQQLSLNKGLKKFGNKGRDAAYKELHQTHNRIVFKPVDVNSLTPEERKKAMESLMFLTKKRNESMKVEVVQMEAHNSCVHLKMKIVAQQLILNLCC